MDTPEIVREVLGEFFVAGKRYHSPLPAELSEWYAYARDSGHNVVCVLTQDYRDDGDLKGKLVPVPVRAVLRGYEIRRGYVVVEVPYSPQFGLLTDPSDDER
jgi:hypothetical protein